MDLRGFICCAVFGQGMTAGLAVSESIRRLWPEWRRGLKSQ